jgi:hypothetical protein
MAIEKIVVPINASYDAKCSFIKEVSSILAAGKDVQFVDDSDNNVNVPFIGLLNGTDGQVTYKSKDGDPLAVTLVAGGFHVLWPNMIYATGTDASLGIHVKLV